MSLIEMFAILSSCGVPRNEVLTYPLPYINAVLPKVMERQLAAINPLALLGASSEESDVNVKKISENKVPTVAEIQAAMANISFG